MSNDPRSPVSLGAGTRATIIYNPVSGTRNVSAALPGALAVLRERGWQLDVQATQRVGDLQRLAAQARDQQQQVVLVAGGDGSINEAANALALSEVALGVLPGGTANVWARQIGVPVPSPFYGQQLSDAARSMAAGVIRPIDLGCANGRYFMLWAGVGLDAHVTAQIEPRPPWVKRFGIAGYTWRAFWIATKYRGTRMTVTIDQREIKCRALMVLISNAQLYGGIVKAAPAAQLDDGWLDVSIFKGGSFREALRHMLVVLLQRTAQDSDVISLRGQRLHIWAKRPCYAHVDAEPIGQTPITIEVAPCALRVIVPYAASPALFVNPGLQQE
ncbi:MAG TPA: diacylglycerol kinase family protein [Anaerolineae bacterium]|nr:diacylglycerol kinase family protein [Anaerolineae bacterium]